MIKLESVRYYFFPFLFGIVMVFFDKIITDDLNEPWGYLVRLVLFLIALASFELSLKKQKSEKFSFSVFKKKNIKLYSDSFMIGMGAASVDNIVGERNGWGSYMVAGFLFLLAFFVFEGRLKRNLGKENLRSE